MNRGLLLACCLLLAFPAASLAQSAPKDSVEYKIVLDCPTGTGVLATTAPQCPIEAWDGDDALGSPALAVDPDNVDNMIFASLHGGQYGSGPEERSRTGQQFTTHTSTNHGASWVDKPYTQPDKISSDATGEQPGIALDPYGHVFISSLYAQPRGGSSSGGDSDPGSSGWDYIISAQKFSSLDDITQNQDGRYNVDYVKPAHAHNRIGQTWFAYDQASDNVVLLWNEQLPQAAHKPANSTAASDPQQTARQLVYKVLPPRDAAAAASAADLDAAPGNGTSAPAGSARSAISWVYTSSDVNDAYYHLATSVIEPCASSTNPVVSEGWLYVGCLVAGGQGAPEWAPNAKAGEIHMFRFRPEGGEPEYIGMAPLRGGAPKLGVRSDGRMALLTTEVLHKGNHTDIRLDGVFGQFDAKKGKVVWDDVHQYGPQLQILYANMHITATNIQDMIYREYSGVLHLILKRVVEWPKDQPYGYRPEFFKAVVAIDENYGLLAEYDLGIGDLAMRQKDSELYSHPASMYNDTADDFLELPPVDDFEYQQHPLGEHYQREFYAVGNYGFVHFAEVVELTTLRGPAAAGLPNPPPPPTPAPSTASSLALGLAGSLTSSAIVAGSAAGIKRKTFTRARRKKRT